jgi:ribosomal protein S18 acetylase RimI-like enzyme
MPSISYRQVESVDYPGMARLRALKRGTKEYWTDRITRYFEGEHNPQLALPPRVGFVAREGETVVGFVTGHLSRRYSCDGELQWIFVDPNHRESGIASELVRLLAKWFIEQKAYKICVDVDPSNETAQRFYKQRGAAHLNPHWLIWHDIRTVLDQPQPIDTNS